MSDEGESGGALGGGVISLLVLVVSAVLGYLVAGVGYCGSVVFFSDQEGPATAAEVGTWVGHTVHTGGLYGAAIAAGGAALVLFGMRIAADGFPGLRASLGFIIEIGGLLGASLVAYLGWNDRLAFGLPSLAAGGSFGNLLTVVAGIVIAVGALVVLRPVWIVEAVGVIPATLFSAAQAVVVLVPSLTAGIIMAVAGAAVLFILFASILSRNAMTLWAAVDWGVAVVAWAAVWAVLVVSGVALATAVRTRARIMAIGGIPWAIAIWAVTAGSAGGAVRDRIEAWEGEVTLVSTLGEGCKTDGYTMEIILESSAGHVTARCEGVCRCTKPIRVQGLPGETLTATLRSGDLAVTADADADHRLEENKPIELSLGVKQVHGELELRHVAKRTQIDERPSATTIQLEATVGREHGIVFPTLELRIRTEDEEAEKECVTTYGSPSCVVSLRDDSIEPDETIEIEVERSDHTFCMFGCEVAKRRLSISELDAGVAPFENEGISIRVTGH